MKKLPCSHGWRKLEELREVDGNGAPNFEEGIIGNILVRVTRIPKHVEQVAEKLEADI